ncbi:hypothetical protein [Helicobacter sp. WB40]|uniref:hypothetical protein n=1 Tax=Helicobacter sp. WB40 TaxID=3004130 RepID=UPI0022EC0F7D|nr:hypothetical protein [Helicobacter sp. WB40]MDA3967409.1 hypothetical protein [Helicobacter sp. WB40]
MKIVKIGSGILPSDVYILENIVQNNINITIVPSFYSKEFLNILNNLRGGGDFCF